MGIAFSSPGARILIASLCWAECRAQHSASAQWETTQLSLNSQGHPVGECRAANQGRISCNFDERKVIPEAGAEVGSSATCSVPPPTRRVWLSTRRQQPVLIHLCTHSQPCLPLSEVGIGLSLSALESSFPQNICSGNFRLLGHLTYNIHNKLIMEKVGSCEIWEM